MALPIFVGAILGAAGSGYQETAITVGVAQILNGKTVHAYGYDGFTNIGTATYGTRTPTTLGGATIETIAHNTFASPDTFEVWLTGSHPKSGILDVVVTDGGVSNTLTVDSNVSHGEASGATYWIWNATNHSLPDWSTEAGNNHTATFRHKQFA